MNKTNKKLLNRLINKRINRKKKLLNKLINETDLINKVTILLVTSGATVLKESFGFDAKQIKDWTKSTLNGASALASSEAMQYNETPNDSLDRKEVLKDAG